MVMILKKKILIFDIFQVEDDRSDKNEFQARIALMQQTKVRKTGRKTEIGRVDKRGGRNTRAIL